MTSFTGAVKLSSFSKEDPACSQILTMSFGRRRGLVTLMILLLRSSLALRNPAYTKSLQSAAFWRNSAFSTVTKTSRRMSSSASADAHVTSTLVNCPSLTLRDGTKHPIIGFGTYKVGYIPPSASAAASSGAPTRSAEDVISDALAVGYRFMECAQFYNNERDIGKALKESGIPREELFLCSKVWTTTIEQGPDAVRQQLEQSLADLQTDYLDLYLIHWPVPTHHVTAYKTLVELKRQGKIRNIGVSNYAWEDYLELKNDPEISDEDLPAVNQIEINPFLYRSKTIDLFQKEGVVMQSYRSLRDGKAFDHPTVASIADRLGKTPAQILGRWCVQKGFAYVPKSARRERMLENAAVFDFALGDEDMERLDALTTKDALQAFVELYRKCVNRDTSKDGTMEGVKMEITID